MMSSTARGSRIVRSYAGTGTVDTIYVTEDGSHWLYNPMIQPVPRFDTTVPQRIGTLIGDVIVEGRRP